MNSILDLPADILLRVLNEVNILQQGAVVLACRQFKELLYANTLRTTLDLSREPVRAAPSSIRCMHICLGQPFSPPFGVVPHKRERRSVRAPPATPPRPSGILLHLHAPLSSRLLILHHRISFLPPQIPQELDVTYCFRLTRASLSQIKSKACTALSLRPSGSLLIPTFYWLVCYPAPLGDWLEQTCGLSAPDRDHLRSS
jgi:hypothetical protein